MSDKENYLNSLTAFQKELIGSEAFKSLKKADEELYEDKALRPYISRKNELEEKLSSAYLNEKDDKAEIMKEYKKLMEEINEVPSVKKYNKAYEDVKKIKEIFDKELIFKLL